MAQRLSILLGTRKGAFLLEGDADRREWALKGPFCDAWPINHMIADPSTGTLLAGGGNPWFGPAVWASGDRGETWTHSSEGLTFGPGEDAVAAVWSLAPGADGALYAGVEPAGLFRSEDGGRGWGHVGGLRDHPTRAEWHPGGGGLILHSIAVDPRDGRRIWVGISAAGVYHSADGGTTWEPRNRGTRADFLPEDRRYPEVGQCVHSIVLAAGGGDRLYQQNHCGMYRSADGGRGWQSIEAGLPSSFGFPAAAHPRDPDALYLLPLNGDSAGRFVPEGRAAVWRTRDGGDSWQALRQGLPQTDAYFGVLRQALATDPLEPAGVYFGTTSGSVFASRDEGDSWTEIARHLPTVLSVETALVDA